MQLNKFDYWASLVDYYYDNIHWDTDPCISIYEWLKRDYNATASLYSKVIQFDNPAHGEWFLLRWSE